MTQVVAPPPSSATRSPVVRRPAGPGRDQAVSTLVALFLGYPLWWLLGVASVLPFVVAVVLLRDLSRRRVVWVPHGWNLWMLYLVWVALSAFLLAADAPGGMPGGFGGGRVLVFVYRAAWYATCATALVWVFTTSSERFSFRRASSLLAYLYVITTIGGIAGILFATADFPSALEAVLPSSLTGNGFVQELVHPGLADVQQVLGHAEARPKAPFPYTNTWGSCLAICLPFFVLSWWRHGKRWQRVATPVVLLASAFPAAFSLNRGLWICLILMVLVLMAVGLVRGRRSVFAAAVALVAVSVLALAFTPLGQLINERLANPHSNARRQSLAVETLKSAAVGSPVLGFGSTRKVQGNFASLAGASTPDCPFCGSPPLGTQGQLWLVIFSQGLVGAVVFMAFFLLALFRTWRCRTDAEIVGTLVLSAFLVQLLIYDTFALPMFLVMLTIGLVAREQRETGVDRVRRTAGQSVRRILASGRVLVLLAVLGAVAGLLVARSYPVRYSVEASMLLPHTPTYVATTPQPVNNPANDVTVDTAGAQLRSDQTLDRVRRVVAPAPGQPPLLDRIALSAEPNSRVLDATVTAASPGEARSTAPLVAQEYLRTTRVQLEKRRAAAIASATATHNDVALAMAVAADTDPGSLIRVGKLEKVSADLEKHIVSGVGLGLLVGVGVAQLWPNLLRSRRRRWPETPALACGNHRAGSDGGLW